MGRFLSSLLSLSLFAGALLLPGHAMAEPKWKLALDQNSVQVWKRPEPDSPVVAFRAETTVTSSLSGLLNLFYDLDAAPQWLDCTYRVVALQRNDVRHEYMMLVETILPWPLKNRDVVIAGQWKQDPLSKAVYMHGKGMPKGSYPENPAYLRYYHLRSDWSFIPVGRGQVRVVMEGHAEPAGNLPAWSINMLIHESPFKTITNLRKIISNSRYQDSHFDGIDEPPADQ